MLAIKQHYLDRPEEDKFDYKNQHATMVKTKYVISFGYVDDNNHYLIMKNNDCIYVENMWVTPNVLDAYQFDDIEEAVKHRDAIKQYYKKCMEGEEDIVRKRLIKLDLNKIYVEKWDIKTNMALLSLIL